MHTDTLVLGLNVVACIDLSIRIGLFFSANFCVAEILWYSYS